MNPVGMALDEKLIDNMCQLSKVICVGLLLDCYLLFAIRSAHNMPCLRHFYKNALLFEGTCMSLFYVMSH
jgi:hypothetical protein